MKDQLSNIDFNDPNSPWNLVPKKQGSTTWKKSTFSTSNAQKYLDMINQKGVLGP